MVKEEKHKMQEESFGGTFGSVVTPSGSALVHNRIETKKCDSEARNSAKTTERDSRA